MHINNHTNTGWNIFTQSIKLLTHLLERPINEENCEKRSRWNILNALFFPFLRLKVVPFFGTLFKVTRHKINIKLKECNQIITFKVSSVYEDYKQQHSFIHIGGLDVCLRRITFCRNTNKTIKRNSFFYLFFSFVH